MKKRKDPKKIPVSDLGEFGLIERVRRRIKTDRSVIKGTGDDCAVLKLDEKNYQLFTCDMIVEGVDFTLKDDPYLIGRKAVAVSVSDIAACAGIPRYCVVSLGLPKGRSLDFCDKLIKGMLSVVNKHKINLAGGDISRAKELVLDVSMLGVVEKKRLVLRSGAKEKDLIFVTGALGGSILGKHLKFTPRLKEARFLVKNFKINSMIDISDGLIQDLGHILKSSSKGALIYENSIPLSRAARGLDDALYSGEDFELIFTMSAAEAKKLFRAKPDWISLIGEITDQASGLRLLDKNGKEKAVRPKGFRHF
ncbi:MAG: thiamine-phosphate kinase [Candidatus Omnitrophica bacterium]|nr:thiamine-phosphate kinase [Candidatus Omnitrophota bacterium]MDD5553372.1 thiamine-phosphate kinase [Candidatus Omnitrophota bacterium]